MTGINPNIPPSTDTLNSSAASSSKRVSSNPALESISPVAQQLQETKSSSSQESSLDPSSIRTLPQDATTLKTTEVTKNSFLSNSLANVGWGVLKTLEAIAFYGTDLESINEESSKKLQDLTGNTNCTRLITLVVPKIISSVEESFDEGVLKDFFIGEGGFTTELTEAMTLKVFANLAEAVKKDKHVHSLLEHVKDLKKVDAAENFPTNDELVTLEQMIGFILKLTNQEYDLIEDQFNQIMASKKTSSEKDKALRILVTPLADKLLPILLPEGANDLPVLPGVRWGAWYVLKNTIVPDLLVDLIKQKGQLQALPTAKQLSKIESKESYSLIGEKVGDLLTTYSTQEIAKSNLTIAEATVKAFSDEDAPKDPALVNWLAEQIKDISLSQNPYLKQAWDFAIHRAEALMIYTIKALAASKKVEEDSSLAASKVILESLNAFISHNNGHIQALKARLVEKGIDPLKNTEYLELFKPLATEWKLLSKMTTDNEQLPQYLLSVADTIFIETLPSYLAEYYDSYLVPMATLYGEGSQKYHQEDVESLRQLLKGAGVEDAESTIQQLENMCDLAVEQVTSIVQKYINDNLKLQSDKPVDIFAHPEIQKLWETRILGDVKNSLFRVIVNNIERSAAKGAIEQAPIAILQDILDAVLGNLTVSANEIQQAEAIEDLEARKEALRVLFKPMAADLLGILNKQSNAQTLPLPIPAVLSAEIWKTLQSDLIPDILADLSLRKNSFLQSKEVSKKGIQALQPDSQIPESCHIMANWVCQFMPGYLGINRQDIAEDILTAVNKHLAETKNPQNLSVEDYLSQNEKQIKQLLCTNMLGIPTSESIKQIQASSKEYVETIFLYVCKGVAESLHDIEDPANSRYQKNATINLAIQLLNVTNTFFTKINKVTDENKKRSADQVSYREMVKGFGHTLHKGVSRTEDGIQAHEKLIRLKKDLETARIKLGQLKLRTRTTQAQLKFQRRTIKKLEKSIKETKQIESKERQTHFYMPFTKKLIELAQLEKPEEIPQAAWEMVENQLVPQFLENVVTTLLEPETRNQIIISIFSKIDKVLDTPTVSPYLAISEAMEDFNNVLISLPEEAYNKKVYRSARRLYSAMEFVSGNPRDKIVQYRWEELSKIIKVQSEKGRVSAELLDAWEKVQQAKHEFTVEQERRKKAKDPLQRKLDKACGNLFLQLVKSVPHSAIKILFKIDKVNELSGEMIGEIVREALTSQGSLLDIFNLSVASTVPVLTPGEWEHDKDGNLHFVPKEAPKEFADLSQDEREDLELQKIYQAQKDAKLAQETIVKVNNRLLVGSIFDILAAPLHKLKEIWDCTVDVVFGKYAPWLRQTIRFLGDKLIFRICTIVLNVAAWPTRKIFSLFTELYVNYRTAHFFKFMHLDIFEGLLYKLADTTLDTLNRRQPVEPGELFKLIAELMQAAKVDLNQQNPVTA